MTSSQFHFTRVATIAVLETSSLGDQKWSEPTTGTAKSRGGGKRSVVTAAGHPWTDTIYIDHEVLSDTT